MFDKSEFVRKGNLQGLLHGVVQGAGKWGPQGAPASAGAGRPKAALRRGEAAPALRALVCRGLAALFPIPDPSKDARTFALDAACLPPFFWRSFYAAGRLAPFNEKNDTHKIVWFFQAKAVPR